MAESVTEKAARKPKTKKRICIAAISLAVLILATLVSIPYVILPMFLGKRYEQKQHIASDYGVEAERIALETDDALSLAAWRVRSASPKGTVVILSGIQNPSVTAFFGYAKLLKDNGWDSLLIEMRARSESEGEEIGFGMTEWRDVKAGVDVLSADSAMRDLPIVTMGTSMGGGTVIIAAGELPQVDGVISVSAFSSWSDLFVDNMAMTGIPKFIGILDIPFINLYLGFHFGFDALHYSPLNGIAKLNSRPILMMHSTGDTQVPYREFEKLRHQAEEHGIYLTTFIREGDEHFVCYDRFFENPAEDTEFSQAVLGFLSSNFP